MSVGLNGRADWIAVDWGTSRLRAWAMSEAGAVLGEAVSELGMGKLARGEFEPTLLTLIAPWLDRPAVPVLACGMVGARQGWREVPYVPVPTQPRALQPHAVTGTAASIRLAILPGLSQEKPADVMRGEETQIAGFLVAQPDFDGVICLPGTHSKWVRVSAGEVVSFQTFMSGELFSLLSQSSVLQHSVAQQGRDEAAFSEAVAETLSRPERVAHALFGIRADAVLNNLDPVTARSRLSGLLIGAELAASRPYWLGQDVAVIGAEDLTETYAAALSSQGLAPSQHDGSAIARLGLAAVYATLSETAS
ncbi:MAG: 2-dehydro-3-deoxygalactonokinase [Pseudomonadota bacterium]